MKMVVDQQKDSKQTGNQEGECVEDISVLSCIQKFNLRPILGLMSLVGCYSLSSPRRKVLSAFMWTYKGSLLITIVLYAVRNLSLFSDPMMVQSLGPVLILSFHSIGNLLISWKTFSTTYGHYNKTIKRFEGVLSKMATNAVSINIPYFNRRHVTFCFVGVLSMLAGFVIPSCITFILFPSSEAFNKIMGVNQTIEVTQPFKETTFGQILLFIAMNINVVPYCIPGFFLMTVSVMMSTTFNALNRRLDYVITLDKEHMFQYFEPLRKIHVDLCSVVGHFDKDLSLMYGNIFMWTIGEGLIVLYILVKYPMPWLVQFSMVFYLVLGTFIITAMSICASHVRDAAHAPLDVIFYTDAEDTNLDKVTQLNLFLSKLTGTHVGFTVFGLLTITKEFILTIAGVFLTYFAVLYTL